MTAAPGADTILAALFRLAEGPPDAPITLGEMVTRLDSRAHALVLLLLAAPNLTPGPSMPGFSTLFGVPLCVVAFEMMLGRRALRLPRFLARIEVRRSRITAIVPRLAPVLRQIERFLAPRAPALLSERAIGAACVMLGVLLTLPIPFFSLAPAAAIVVLALGLLTRDGAAVAVGLSGGAASCALYLGLAVALIAAFGVDG